MRIKITKKGNRYRRRFSFDAEDWVTMLVVVIVLGFVVIQILLN